ncbi:hypothetical protein ACFLY6_00495 [Candidatus Dependentiae bacterium]
MLKRFFIASLVFCISFLYWTVPYKDWRFFDDDYGAVHAGSIKSVSDIADFFTTNPNDRSILPSNMRDDTEWTFFGVMYRPLALVMYAAEVYFFGPNNPHAYFLVSMALHSACGALLFYILSLIMPLLFAFFGSMVFVVYPMMGMFIGRFVMQTYSVAFLGLGLSILFLRRFFNEKRVFWYIFSILCFAIVLFVHEATIVFPVWLFCMLPFYFDSDIWPIKKNVVKSLFVSMPYFGVVAINLFFRLLVYPLASNSDYMLLRPLDFLHRLSFRFFDLVTLVVDALGLSFVPGGNRFSKSLLVLAVLSWILYVFVKSNRKRDMIFIGSGFLFFSWPAILITHQARYLYLGIPFLVAAVGLGMASVRRFKWYENRMIFCGYWITILVAGFIFCMESTKARERYFVSVDNVFKALAEDKRLLGRPICFVGVPKELIPCPGAAQAVWIYRKDDADPVYHDPQMNVCCKEIHTALEELKVPSDAKIDISIDGKKVRISIDTPEKIWICTHDPFGRKFSFTMGTLEVLKSKNGRAFDVLITISEKWYSPEMAFVTWDFENNFFMVQ